MYIYIYIYIEREREMYVCIFVDTWGLQCKSYNHYRHALPCHLVACLRKRFQHP